MFKKAKTKNLRPGEFEHEGLGCKFAIPERVTVRVHQKYVDARDEAERAGAISMLAVNWVSAVAIIEEWECKALPDFRAELDDIADEQLAIINWAGVAVYTHIISLAAVPKN